MRRVFLSAMLLCMLLVGAVCTAVPLEAQGEANDTAAGPGPAAKAAIEAWKRQVVSLMARHRDYPAEAKSRGEQGTVQVLFRLDRQGCVTTSRVLRSSGFETLDDAALEWVRRAQPFPPPPSDMTDAQLEMIMPIRFQK